MLMRLLELHGTGACESNREPHCPVGLQADYAATSHLQSNVLNTFLTHRVMGLLVVLIAPFAAQFVHDIGPFKQCAAQQAGLDRRKRA